MEMKSENEWLAREIIDIMTNDSEKPHRILDHLSDDCIWIINPGNMRYFGIHQIRTFIDVALSMRNRKQHSKKSDSEVEVHVEASFTDGEMLCIEYAHVFSFGSSIPIIGSNAGRTEMKHCNVYKFRNGKVAEIHEYALSSLWWLNLASQIILKRVWKKTLKIE